MCVVFNSFAVPDGVEQEIGFTEKKPVDRQRRGREIMLSYIFEMATPLINYVVAFEKFLVPILRRAGIDKMKTSQKCYHLYSFELGLAKITTFVI